MIPLSLRPFEGSSTSHNDFAAPPPQPRPVMMKAPVAAPQPMPFEGVSTYKDCFKLLTVPHGPAELGLQARRRAAPRRHP